MGQMQSFTTINGYWYSAVKLEVMRMHLNLGRTLKKGADKVLFNIPRTWKQFNTNLIAPRNEDQCPNLEKLHFIEQIS